MAALRFLIPATLPAILLAGCSPDTPKPAAKVSSHAPAKIQPAASKDLPPPIQALATQGFKLRGTFTAPDGLRGYAGTLQGKPMAAYVTPNGRYAVVGTLVNASGFNLSAEPLQKLVRSQLQNGMWPKLEKAHWIGDGAADAAQVVYMFSDPNCPFCRAFWKSSRPWVVAGKVQIRHILVAILKPSSAPKAAAILAASDPAAALDRFEKAYSHGDTEPVQTIPDDVAFTLHDNVDLMTSLGFSVTPTIVYRDTDGRTHAMQGMPRQGKDLNDVMGSSRP